MINLMIIYDVVYIFSMKNYKSSRKLGVGLNWYPGVNWSTTTRSAGGVGGGQAPFGNGTGYLHQGGVPNVEFSACAQRWCTQGRVHCFCTPQWCT